MRIKSVSILKDGGSYMISTSIGKFIVYDGFELPDSRGVVYYVREDINEKSLPKNFNTIKDLYISLKDGSYTYVRSLIKERYKGMLINE